MNTKAIILFFSLVLLLQDAEALPLREDELLLMDAEGVYRYLESVQKLCYSVLTRKFQTKRAVIDKDPHRINTPLFEDEDEISILTLEAAKNLVGNVGFNDLDLHYNMFGNDEESVEIRKKYNKMIATDTNLGEVIFTGQNSEDKRETAPYYKRLIQKNKKHA